MRRCRLMMTWKRLNRSKTTGPGLNQTCKEEDKERKQTFRDSTTLDIKGSKRSTRESDKLGLRKFVLGLAVVMEPINKHSHPLDSVFLYSTSNSELMDEMIALLMKRRAEDKEIFIKCIAEDQEHRLKVDSTLKMLYGSQKTQIGLQPAKSAITASEDDENDSDPFPEIVENLTTLPQAKGARTKENSSIDETRMYRELPVFGYGTQMKNQKAGARKEKVSVSQYKRQARHLNRVTIKCGYHKARKKKSQGSGPVLRTTVSQCISKSVGEHEDLNPEFSLFGKVTGQDLEQDNKTLASPVTILPVSASPIIENNIHWFHGAVTDGDWDPGGRSCEKIAGVFVKLTVQLGHSHNKFLLQLNSQGSLSKNGCGSELDMIDGELRAFGVVWLAGTLALSDYMMKIIVTVHAAIYHVLELMRLISTMWEAGFMAGIKTEGESNGDTINGWKRYKRYSMDTYIYDNDV
ncbi:hypothetical protein HID58_013663, partial [Brassica napus]